MNTPLAYSIVPIAPSQTSTRSSSASRNSFIVRLLVNLLIFQRLRIDQQVRPVDAVDTHRPHALAHGLDEAMMMPAQMEPRLHRGEHAVDRGLPRVAPPGMRALLRFVDDDEGARGFVRHQDVDVA